MRISDWSSDVCSSDLCQPRFGLDPRADFLGDRARRAEPANILGDVEIRFVERQRLDQHGVIGEDRANLLRDRAIDLEARLDEHEIGAAPERRSEEHTSELQSLMRISYAVFCLKKKNNTRRKQPTKHNYTAQTKYVSNTSS